MKLVSNILLLPAVTGAWSFEALASDDGSRFQGLTYPHLSDSGSVLFGAELDNGSVAVFSGAPASAQITPIISTSDSIPGHPGQRFVGGVDGLVGSHEPATAWAFRGRGSRIPGPDQRRFQGIYRSNSAQHPLHWQTVAETHNPMPSSGGATFAVFSAPSISDAGQVIFGGWNDTNAPIWKGIYSHEQNKPPTMLVDSSSLHPTLRKPFTDIEGSLASFDGNTVAFFAAVDKHAGLFTVDTRTRQLRTLADMSTSVPHGNSTDETFTAFSAPAMSADGSTVGFYATGSQDTEGVYVVSADGVVHCVADTSMNVSVALPANSSSSSGSNGRGVSVQVRLVGFSQPPSLDDRTHKAMFLANTMPPEYSGIYVADAWGSAGIRAVVTLATAKAEGLGEIVYLGFHGSSLNGTKFVFYATGANNSKVYVGTADGEPSMSRGRRLRRGRASA